VGIGTNSPSFNLTAKGAANQAFLSTEDSTGVYRGIYGTDSAVGAGALFGSLSNHPAIIRTNNTERMRIDSSGNLYCSGGSGGTILTLTASSGTTSGDIGRIRFGNNDIDSNLANIVGYQDGATNSGGLKFETQPTGGATVERMRLDASGNLLVGTTSNPVTSTSVFSKSGGGASITVGDIGTPTNRSEIFWRSTNENRVGWDSTASAYLAFHNGSERMRLDSSGNLLVNSTASSINAGSISLEAQGRIRAGRANGTVLQLNRTGSDGDIAIFYKDGTTQGNIGVASNVLTIFATSSSNCGIGFYSNSTVRPLNNSGAQSDNAIDLGDSGARWDDIYATNGTIQTSDRNEKQDIEALSDAETAVAVACKGLLRKFRWIDSVEEKGDDARIHFGIIAQDLQAAFAAEGLDAGRYAMFTSNTWWETQTEVDAVEAVEFVQAVEAIYNEDNELVSEAVEGVEAVEAKDAYTRTDTFQTLADAPEGATERTRLGVRYPELLAFIIAAI